MAIKKDFTAIIDLLTANKSKNVSNILPQIIALASSKKQSTLKYNDAKKLTHVFCFYHKKWEDISKVEYGKKAGTKSGLNTMCKKGTNQWTKQQRVAKQARDKLLEDVATGKVPHTNLKKFLEDIEAKRKAIV